MTNVQASEEIDQSIAAALRLDGRATVRSIAEAVNLPESTTRTRVNALLESGRVSVTAVLHPSVASSTVTAYLRVVLQGSVDVETAASAFPRSYWTAQVVGQPEILTTFDVPSLRDVARLIDEIGQLPFVVDVVPDVALGIYTGLGTPEEAGGDVGLWPEDPGPRLDEFDRQLIHALELDGRASYTALSQETGLSLSQTRRRVMQLIESGTIRIWTIAQAPDPNLARGTLELRVGVKDVLATVERLIRHPGVVSVARMLRSSTLALELSAYDSAQLDALIARLTSEPGIQIVAFERITLLKRRLQDRSLQPASC